MTHRIGAKGQVVIPKDLREQAGLHPGAQVDFALEGGYVVLSVRSTMRPLRSRFGHSGMAARLVEDHASEPR